MFTAQNSETKFSSHGVVCQWNHWGALIPNRDNQSSRLVKCIVGGHV